MTDPVVFSPESVKILLENGGDINIRDNNGLTAILYAAHNNGIYPNLALLNSLLQRDDIPRQDKVDAMEMAGAIIFGSLVIDEEDVTLAFRYWRGAHTLSLMGNEDCRPICKTPLKSKDGSLSEWTSLDDLRRIEMDPTEREMQSLFVQLRLFSSLGWRAIRQHFWRSIEILQAKVLMGKCSFLQFLDLTWVLWNTILRSERPQESDLCSSLLGVVSDSFMVLEFLQRENPIPDSEILNKLAEIIFLMVDPLCFTPGASNALEELLIVNKTVTLSDQLFRMLSNHPQLISEVVRQHLIQLVGRGGIRDSSGRNLLLRSCTELDSDTLPTIRFLVHLGENLNSRDSFGFGALHLLALAENGELRDATARLLLKLGAHLDLAIGAGRTATDLWLHRNNQQRQHLPDWLQEGVPKLMCLSSRVIRRNKLPYKEINVLPVVLVPFVSLH